VLVLAHVVHDLRPKAETLADRDAVKHLADRLGIEFVEASVQVRFSAADAIDPESRNLEARARRLRYTALAELARSRSIRFIATGHHADDQLETMLMALVRGSGPAGLAGMRPSRRLANRGSMKELTLIRPMIDAGMTREMCRDLCRRAAFAWREDATNTDVSRLRAAIRHAVIPQLVAIRPKAAIRATRAADLLADAHEVVRRRAATVLRRAEIDCSAQTWRGSSDLVLDRRALRVRTLVLGQVIRSAIEKCCETYDLSLRKDTLTTSALGPLMRAIRDESGERRLFSIAGMHIELDAQHVLFSVLPLRP
jgi:tRNA(Ile)-lysidine synthetase-like protein